MTLIWLGIILIVLIGLYLLKIPILAWVFIWPLAVYSIIRFAIHPPVPASVLGLYLGLSILAVLVYVLSDENRAKSVGSGLLRFVIKKEFTLLLYGVMLALPLLLAYRIYSGMTIEVKAPTFGRTVHPAPPGEITFKGKKIDLIRGKNPYRELETNEPEKFREHLAQGKRVYYQNCVFCHGDDMRGDGVYAHGLSPVPASFNSATTISMLQEGYLFWRIAKGGPGLPEESGPWSSSMPAWEKFLSEDEIWDVILYLYDHTGLKPRAEEEEHH